LILTWKLSKRVGSYSSFVYIASMVLADDLPVLSAKTLEVAVDISKANQDANRLTVDLGYISQAA